ncbi:MAG: toll/interleukin-1 receptor domain-containing protein, partial [Pseudomonadota bacterium]
MRGGKIFINYRRADTRWAAARIYDDLGERFGHDRLFMDVDSIPAGADFVEHLNRHVDECEAILVLIGRDWLTLTSEDGVRRIDDQADFVTIEIARALQRGVRVIPVLVDGADAPADKDLPELIKPLCRRQALRIDHDSYRRDFDAVAAALAPELQNLTLLERNAPDLPENGSPGA